MTGRLCHCSAWPRTGRVDDGEGHRRDRRCDQPGRIRPLPRRAPRYGPDGAPTRATIAWTSPAPASRKPPSRTRRRRRLRRRSGRVGHGRGGVRGDRAGAAMTALDVSVRPGVSAMPPGPRARRAARSDFCAIALRRPEAVVDRRAAAQAAPKKFVIALYILPGRRRPAHCRGVSPARPEKRRDAGRFRARVGHANGADDHDARRGGRRPR